MIELQTQPLLHLLLIFKLKRQFVDPLEAAIVAFHDGLGQLKVLNNLRELQFLEMLSNLLHLLLAAVQFTKCFLGEAYGHEGCLNVSGGRHKNFLQAWDAESHVCTAVPRQMERVQGHLS